MSGPFCVGLTGGVASGKSTVARLFRDLGVPVRDADAVAREVVAPGQPALVTIGEQFGKEYLTADGELDRRAMRQRVFGDAEARARLEAITHPAIRDALANWRSGQRADYCIVEAAILFEAGFDALTDRTLLVDASIETQLSRLIDRDGIDRALAEQMLAAQMPREQRRARADDRIDNDGSTDALRASVDRLHAAYIDRARQAADGG